jgi:hypothetical protein
MSLLDWLHKKITQCEKLIATFSSEFQSLRKCHEAENAENLLEGAMNWVNE